MLFSIVLDEEGIELLGEPLQDDASRGPGVDSRDLQGP
jgi:hypothetical protein